KELLGFGRHAVDLVDEDDIAALDAGQDADEILAALEIGAEVRMEPHAKLGGDEVRERRLPESRHPGKEDVIEDLAACLRSVDREAEVLDDALLADELGERARTKALLAEELVVVALVDREGMLITDHGLLHPASPAHRSSIARLVDSFPRTPSPGVVRSTLTRIRGRVNAASRATTRG